MIYLGVPLPLFLPMESKDYPAVDVRATRQSQIGAALPFDPETVDIR
jgi:hypothetical protein